MFLKGPFVGIWYNWKVILTLSFKIKRPLRSQKQRIFTGYTRTKFLLKETFHFPVKWYSFSQKMKLAPEFDHIKNSQFFILDMCDKLLDIFSSFWFSDERTFFFSLNPGLSTCQKRFEESFLFPPLGRFVPSCKDDGRFQERQCHPSTGHCWCVDSYGTELLGTRTRGRPNCTVPGNAYIHVTFITKAVL